MLSKIESVNLYNQIVAKCVANSQDNKTHAREIDDLFAAYRCELAKFNAVLTELVEISANLAKISGELAQITETVVV